MGNGKRTAGKVERLTGLLHGRRSLLIVTQDNPDPDAIASAAALRKLANAVAEVPCSIGYGGVIGRAENQALVGYLGLNFRSMADLDIGRFDTVALVDTQPGTGNNALPADRTADIVLDHHPLRPESRVVPFTDIRTRYGSVSTLMYEYLVEVGLVPGPPLATALLYGIRTDTHDLGGRAARADIAASEALYPLANTRMLSAIQRGSVPRSYYAALWYGLDAARIYGSAIVSGLGRVANPDMMGELADLLMRHENAQWVLCHGIHHRTLQVSVRSASDEHHAGQAIGRVVEGLGTGGGHARSAGAQVELGSLGEAQRRRLLEQVRRRFLRETGQTGHRARRLVVRRAVAEPSRR